MVTQANRRWERRSETLEQLCWGEHLLLVGPEWDEDGCPVPGSPRFSWWVEHEGDIVDGGVRDTREEARAAAEDALLGAVRRAAEVRNAKRSSGGGGSDPSPTRRLMLDGGFDFAGLGFAYTFSVL